MGETLSHELKEARDGIAKGIAGKHKFSYSEAGKLTSGGARRALAGLKKI